MNFKRMSWILVVFLASIVMLFALFKIEKRMDSDIRENHLRFSGTVHEASPVVSFTTVALGSFRGLLADILWIRNGKLQEKNNFFEMVQLAQWMTDLQPEFSGAAAYLAWNMAYNVSVACSFHEDRWRWVNEGIKLLRDRAIVYNPEDPARYKELGWIFLHKIGNILDPSQQYYKTQLALDMMKAVTPHPQWDKIAAAPADYAAFEKKYPSDSRMQDLIRAAGYPDMDKLFDAFKENGEMPERVTQVFAGSPLEEDLEFYLRRQLLQKRYKLDPNVVIEINNKFGELDWRLPEAQAIYWATMGIKKTPKGVRPVECDRIITQSLPEAFRAGRLVYLDKKDADRIMIAPNLNLIDTALAAFDEGDERAGDKNMFLQGRRSFVKYATTMLYCFGKKAKAAKYFKIAKNLDPGIPRDMPLDAFAKKEIAEELEGTSQKRLMAFLSALLFQSFDCRIAGDTEGADGNETMAKYLYAKFQKTNKGMDRVLLPPYTEIRNALLDDYCKSLKPQYARILRDHYANQTEAQKQDDAAPAVPPKDLLK